MEIIYTIDSNKKIRILNDEQKLVYNYMKLLYDIYEMRNPIQIYESTSLNYIKSIVDETLLMNLNETEKNVIILRYGLEDGKIFSLYEIGQKLGPSEAQIRLIEESILKN